MEITGNKYLHKKFKKQSSTYDGCTNDGSSSGGGGGGNSTPVVAVHLSNGDTVRPHINSTSNSSSSSSSGSDKDNNNKQQQQLLLQNVVISVPNYNSTNCDYSSVANNNENQQQQQQQQPLPECPVYNSSVNNNNNTLVNNKDNPSSISKTVDLSGSVPLTKVQNDSTVKNKYNSVNNCISSLSTTATTTTTTLVTASNQQQQQQQQQFSFDTKTTHEQQSSILNNTLYSKTSTASVKSVTDSSILHFTDTATTTTTVAPVTSTGGGGGGGGKYVCTYCNLACSKPSVLQKHIRAHTNERPYPCVSCGFSFKTRSNLYKHCRSRTHANRVMGNKHVTHHTDSMDECASEDYMQEEKLSEDDRVSEVSLKQQCALDLPDVQKDVTEQTKSKPYKPRFHQAKMFFEESKLKENDSKLDNVVKVNVIGPSMYVTAGEDVEEVSKHKLAVLDVQDSYHIRTNPDLLKLRINELINKNNSIVNCDDAVVLRRRNVDNYIVENNTTTTNNNNNINNSSSSDYIYSQTLAWNQLHHQQAPLDTGNRLPLSDEPLNLTSKNRKRCLSDSADNSQKSLIKELLLKNLSQDPNLQCPYCKMIFQTVTELEMHKLKYCNAKCNTNIRYARSSSVNVASILTQNKNAFDNIPHMQHTTFPLKSPGPFLGKTRLIESDRVQEKYRTFSFDDNVILHHSQSDAPSFNKYMLHSPVGYPPLSPHVKKNSIKLFGGEVKITQTSGETRSFKIESESINKLTGGPANQQSFMEFSGGNLSENLVIKSSLQSGGTVLQNKANYSPKMDTLPSPNIIRVYDNTDIVSSPGFNLPVLKENFTFDRPSMVVTGNDKLLLSAASNEHMLKRKFVVREKCVEARYDNGIRHGNSEVKHDNEKDKEELYKSNLMDFGQKAVKLLAPNLKPPNLTIPGLPIPAAPGDKLYSSSPTRTMAPLELGGTTTTITTGVHSTTMDKQHLENLNFAKKQISLQQRMAEVSQPQHVYNPMNIFVNGKVIRYVPGIPGPIAEALPAADVAYNNLPHHSPRLIPHTPTTKCSNKDTMLVVVKEPKPTPTTTTTTTTIVAATAAATTIITSLEPPTTPTTLPNGGQHEKKQPALPMIIVDHQQQHEQAQQQQQQAQKIVFASNKSVSLRREAAEKASPELSPSKCASGVAVLTTVAAYSHVTASCAKEESRKFVRPTSLALKPNSNAFKSHHGLTPTMFNQALISPDTPRVAKKYCQQYLNGNYFSYLGLKSSTKSVYCTLNKTQPFYVKHFKKLSMYSEWRQQESKIDSLSVTAYDSSQRAHKYTMAGSATADLVAHSSYKFVQADSEAALKEDNANKNSPVLGGYESNEDYTYIRGRGRGRYVCDQCGIRCKKPSMLKKHIRTHSDDRPYTCEHCNFSFKTKGNLTKHMKSKAHSKKYAATSSSSSSGSSMSAQNSGSTSSTDSEDSEAESSDESTRLQEHEAAHCLLSLAQKNNNNTNQSSISAESGNIYNSSATAAAAAAAASSTTTTTTTTTTTNNNTTTGTTLNLSELPNFLKDDEFLKNPDQINHVTNANFAKNKILDETSNSFSASKHLTEMLEGTSVASVTTEMNNMTQYLGKSTAMRPLTYPYLQTQLDLDNNNKHTTAAAAAAAAGVESEATSERSVIKTALDTSKPSSFFLPTSTANVPVIRQNEFFMVQSVENAAALRKRKLSSSSTGSSIQYKMQRHDSLEAAAVSSSSSSSRIVDLSGQEASILDLSPACTQASDAVTFVNGGFHVRRDEHADVGVKVPLNQVRRREENNDAAAAAAKISVNHARREDGSELAAPKLTLNVAQRGVIFNNDQHACKPAVDDAPPLPLTNERINEPLIIYKARHNSFSESNSSETFSQNSDTNDRLSLATDNALTAVDKAVSDYGDQDQSAMQTLAEIATKQVKLEKNILAKNVASEYLKLASNCDGGGGGGGGGVGGSGGGGNSVSEGGLKKYSGAAGREQQVSELIVKPEESKSCSICAKNFSKPSQLRLHMNIHYLERPFRCESCSVSFRTKGHLQKHERSASHHNKLSSSPALSSSEPRPFKCSDCNIAFRIHGHLAKHLRSKMHIMKLECLAKIPFGLYAELERANSLLTEINTTDGDLCLESLKILARKLFSNDPNKLDQLGSGCGGSVGGGAPEPPRDNS